MRRMSLGLILMVFLCGFLTAGVPQASDSSKVADATDASANTWFSKDAKTPVLRVDVFVTSDCPHCQKLTAFFKAKAPQNPWLKINYYVINQDKMALLTYFKVLKLKNLEDFAVPAVFFCNSRWVGFMDAESSGNTLLKNLNYCRQEIIKEGHLTLHTEQMLQQMSFAHWSQKNFDRAMPDWIVILSTAFFDAISPETVFIILTLLCFMRIEAALPLKAASFVLFLLGVGGAHYFQQVYAPQFYETIPFVRLPSMLIGLGLLIYLFIFHPKMFANRKPLPAILTLLWLLLTGLAVQWYQQMHVPNFSLGFLQWMLAKGELGATASKLYPLFYQLIYLISIGFITWLWFMILIYYGKWTPPPDAGR